MGSEMCIRDSHYRYRCCYRYHLHLFCVILMLTPQHSPLAITFEAASPVSNSGPAVISASLEGRSELEVLRKGLRVRR